MVACCGPYHTHLLTFLFFIFESLNDFKEFANAIDAIKDKGVVVAVACPDDVEAANKERSDFFQVKKVL